MLSPTPHKMLLLYYYHYSGRQSSMQPSDHILLASVNSLKKEFTASLTISRYLCKQ